MRQVSNIAMATLIVTALFFGNCLSCPRMLMALSNHQPGHGCCHHSTPKIDCHSQVLSHFVKAQGGNVSPMFAASGMAPAVATFVMLDRPALSLWRAADVAPPDLLSFYSLLRV